ncbi:MAG: nucleoside-diphosphate sugar epimerase [Planctomycetaceae bacterium]|nr:nucleoside-diphosphate sugar epimerase [Planctomycetaceae bacterium]
MRTLITGGAGFIGSHLTERLLEAGDEVTIIDDLSTGRCDNVEPSLKHERCRIIINSIRDEALMDRLVEDCDRVFHLAAAVGVNLIVDKPVHTIETNIHGSEVVLSAAAKYRRKVLIASTSEVYGKSTQIPFREDDDVVYGNTTLRRWSYAVSKAVDEFLGLAYHNERGLPVVLVRLFNTVGPRQTGKYGMVIPRFVDAALHGRPLQVYGDGEQSRCFGDVADVVGAMIGLMNEPKAVGQLFNIGNDQPITIRELAERVIALTGSKSKIESLSYDEAYGPGFDDMRARVPCLDKIKATIGYEPTYSLDDILGRVIDQRKSEMGKA